jgi:hypothetical protein
VVPGVVFALMPKCMVCGLAYIGLGTLFGLTGPELCGGEITSAGPGSGWPAWVGVALGTLAVLILRQRFGIVSQKIPRGHAL